MTEKEEREAVNPSAKRSKTHVLLSDVLSSHILDQRQAFIEQYNQGQPYPHCILPNLFQESFFDGLLQEIKQNSKVNFKESDLFKFFQSIDLANLDASDPIAASMPSVLTLRQVLYSDEWRQFIESVAGLPPNTLSQQVDCACNCHVAGCHLLCHDDVIGTRRISYILYLTDHSWTQEEGGALELYAADENFLPTVVPSSTALPIRNSMAFFAVEPGVSFHAVQEVLGERPRLSLQGWYHATEPPANIQMATLQRLKSTRNALDENDSDYETLSLDEAKVYTDAIQLSEEDRKYLSTYMDPTYLQSKALEDMRATFEENSSIQLRSFLNQETSHKIKLEEKQLSVTDSGYYEQGADSNWKLVGPSHMQRYLEYQDLLVSSRDEASVDQELGCALNRIKREVLQSPQFARFLSTVTGLVPTGYKGRIRRFRRGLDYTVAHCRLLTESPVLDATLCFVAGTGKQQVMNEDEGDDQQELDEADLAWQSGDVGGFECYIEADDDDTNGGTAADEYNQDDDTELLSVSAAFNTLSIVFRDPGTLRFVKYVSAKAPSSRWDVSMEYRVDNLDEHDEQEDSDTEE